MTEETQRYRARPGVEVEEDRHCDDRFVTVKWPGGMTTAFRRDDFDSIFEPVPPVDCTGRAIQPGDVLVCAHNTSPVVWGVNDDKSLICLRYGLHAKTGECTPASDVGWDALRIIWPQEARDES